MAIVSDSQFSTVLQQQQQLSGLRDVGSKTVWLQSHNIKYYQSVGTLILQSAYVKLSSYTVSQQIVIKLHNKLRRLFSDRVLDYRIPDQEAKWWL